MANNNQEAGGRPVSVFSGVGTFFAKLKMRTIIIALSVITVLLIGLNMYFGFMAFSIYNVGLRFGLVFLALLWCVPLIIKFSANKKYSQRNLTAFNKVKWGWKVPAIVGIIVLLITLGLALFTQPIFMAKNYFNMINVNEDVKFDEDIQNYNEMLVPIVDKRLAIKLGEKRLGEDNLGSQFTINDYTMSYYNGDIYWIGAIEYTGFFKWTSNNKNGSPGYVMISATDPTKIQIVRQNIKFVPSAYFGQDLERKLYFSNMGRFRAESVSFELDDNGVPHYIQACYKKKFGVTSGNEAIGVIILNAITGDNSYYPNGQEPEWVDRVIPTELITTQLNYWGKYNHGFWNTIFAKKELNITSDGFNYVYNNGHFYLTTGITSIASDESIVGMILSDLKTKETGFYKVTGATEEAAMRSAEGQIQNFQYKATFPVLVNFEGIPTYLTTLKDEGGLVKEYAYVNVQDFTKVGVSTNGNLQDADANYRKKMNIGAQGDTAIEENIIGIQHVLVDGNSEYYIKLSGDANINKIYKAKIQLSDELPFLSIGDRIKITYKETPQLGIYITNLVIIK